MSDVDRRVARLAARQFGVFTRAQVARQGASRGEIEYRLLTGRWHRGANGIYLLAEYVRSWERSLMIAHLGVEGSVVSDGAAARLAGMLGYETSDIELTVTPAKRCDRDAFAIHRRTLRRVDTCRIGAFRATTPARTLIDLAGGGDYTRVEIAFDDAVRRKIVGENALVPTIERAGSVRGVAFLKRLVRERRVGIPNSPLETLAFRMLVDAGLTPPALQHPIFDHRGNVVCRVDFAYPEKRLIIEADSRGFHFEVQDWLHDEDVRGEVAALGWRVVPVTYRDVTRRKRLIVERVARALACDASVDWHPEP